MQYLISRSLMRSAAVAALAVMPAVPALAVSNFTLDSRSSQQNLRVFGGIAYLGTEVGGGSQSTTALQPTQLNMQGSDTEAKADLFWVTRLTASWQLRQDYGVEQSGADTLFQSSGSLKLVSETFNCNGPVCYSDRGLGFTSLNTQSFSFTLDADTAFTASGSSGLGQEVNLRRWDPVSGNWLADWQSGWSTFATYGGTPLLGPQAQRAWSQSGMLRAGTYALRNSNDEYRRFDADGANYSWSYSLRLTDTLLAQPVPEPGAWALMLAGLVGIGLTSARRRRG